MASLLEKIHFCPVISDIFQAFAKSVKIIYLYLFKLVNFLPVPYYLNLKLNISIVGHSNSDTSSIKAAIS